MDIQMDNKIWLEFLGDMKKQNKKVKIYLKEKNQISQIDNESGIEVIKLNNIMLQGFIDDFDASSIRLKNQVCLIERPSVMSISISRSE